MNQIPMKTDINFYKGANATSSTKNFSSFFKKTDCSRMEEDWKMKTGDTFFIQGKGTDRFLGSGMRSKINM